MKAAFCGDCSDHDFSVTSAKVIPINAGVPFFSKPEELAEMIASAAR